MGRRARVSVSRQQGVIEQVHSGRARTKGKPFEIARDPDDLGSGAGMQSSFGTSAMVGGDGRAVRGMVVVGDGHVGDGAGIAAAKEGMVAPGPGVHA